MTSVNRNIIFEWNLGMWTANFVLQEDSRTLHKTVCSGL